MDELEAGGGMGAIANETVQYATDETNAKS
jgi:hypothetical protein